jgi:UDP-glucose:(heptosyl)LPS alpha-1,3-glucosyltransferase
MLECANFLQARGHETHVYASDWDLAALHPDVIRHPIPACARPFPLRLLSYRRNSSLEVRNATPPPDVHGTFGVISPAGGVMWVPSVHKAWLDISKRQRPLPGYLKQKINPLHPMLLAMEHSYFACRQYSRLIALTDQVKADLMRFYQVPSEDIVTLPNGYAPSEFNIARRRESRAAMRRKLGYSEADKVVIFVANELERKGFGTLIHALAELNDPCVRLLVVGRVNPASYSLEIKRLGLAERVQFTGPSSDVAVYYAAADVFALPTRYEAWGLVVVEAIACGLPVLTSRLAGAAVAVREGETGYLLDNPRDTQEVAQKLALLLEGRMASPDSISESVAEYAWSRVLLNYEAILSDCVGLVSRDRLMRGVAAR